MMFCFVIVYSHEFCFTCVEKDVICVKIVFFFLSIYVK